jgi:hypothetical protein
MSKNFTILAVSITILLFGAGTTKPLRAQEINPLISDHCDPPTCSESVDYVSAGYCETDIYGGCAAGEEPTTIGGVYAQNCDPAVSLSSNAQGASTKTYPGYTLMGYVAGFGYASHIPNGAPFYEMSAITYCNLKEGGYAPPPVPSGRP